MELIGVTVIVLNPIMINISFQNNLRLVHHDINVTGVWEHNITGKGVVVSVIDDGELSTQ